MPKTYMALYDILKRFLKCVFKPPISRNGFVRIVPEVSASAASALFDIERYSDRRQDQHFAKLVIYQTVNENERFMAPLSVGSTHRSFHQSEFTSTFKLPKLMQPRGRGKRRKVAPVAMI